MMSTIDSRVVLEEFLSCPIGSTDAVFARFENLPGAIVGRGAGALERYVCIPGTRKNKVVLVAHADTVWDCAYGKSAENSLCFENGFYKSANPECGIGADDRAGCALLWSLRESGHTILVVSGEENGKIGAKFLKKSNPGLFRFLNRHQFMIELDWKGTGGCLYNQVDYTNRFRKYITNTLGFREDSKGGGCDLEVLCKRICGVNIGVGYYAWHHPKECLSLAEWEHTHTCLKAFLDKVHPRFPISVWKRARRFLARVKGKVFRILKISK